MAEKLAQARARADDYLPLSEFERRMLQRLFGNPSEIPPEFWAAMTSKMEVTGPRLLAESISGLKGEEWREVGATGQPIFENAWVNHTPGTFATAAFYKDAMGVVHLKGLVKNGTGGAAVFTLPVGYRPTAQHSFATDSGTAVVHSQLAVLASGAVIVSLGAGATNAYASLECNFRAA
jgi:hypothetical protein